MKELNFPNDRMMIHCNPLWNDASWLVEFVKISDSECFANLWLLDDYDGYLAQWKHCKVSPVFSTREEAKKYALEKWDGQEV
ncbi:MAG: hypothetical protein ACPG49_02580 [Chitinophagales bacterium]